MLHIGFIANLGRRIANVSPLAIRAAAGRKDADAVAECGDDNGLIEGQPVLDSISNCTKHDFGVAGIVLDDLVEVEPSSVPTAAIQSSYRPSDLC